MWTKNFHGTRAGALKAWEKRRKKFPNGYGNHWTQSPNAQKIFKRRSATWRKSWNRKTKKELNSLCRRGVKTRKERGSYFAWNKGLTKENSPIIAEMVKKSTISIRRGFKKGRRVWMCGRNTKNDPRVKCLIEKGKKTRLLKYGNTFGKTAWNKGLTVLTDSRVAKWNKKSIKTRIKKYGNAFGIISQIKFGTSIEKALRKEMRANKIKFLEQIPIFGTIIDFILFKNKIAIFTDGCHWHCCQGNKCLVHPKWKNCKRCGGVEADEKHFTDQKINRKIKKAGWKVLRFWEHEIKHDLQNCIDRLIKAI